MPLPEATTAALRASGVPFETDVPLAPRVSWRVGGPADALVEPRTVAELAQVQAIAADTGVDMFPLGRGSNLLVADAGIRGLVVRLAGDLAAPRLADDGGTAIVGAGTALVSLLSFAKEHRLPGWSCYAGIPGTMGGAVRMNAGSLLGETIDTLLDVTWVLRGGAVETRPASTLAARYRHVEAPAGAILAEATLRVGSGDFGEEQERLTAFLKRRKDTQPLTQPSCGSTFRNPPGDAAGRLIEACGLKGFRIGGAEVSEKHANFVVNTGGATADDVRAVVEAMRRRVEDQTGVRLEPEVHLAGDWGARGTSW